MSDKRISVRKVAGGIVKANLKLWGGDKVPYLNNSVNAIGKWINDPSSFMAEYKVPISDQQKIKNTLTKIEKNKKDLGKLESELSAIKSIYTDIIDKTHVKSLEIVLAAPNSFKSSVIYSITPNLLKRLGISSMRDVQFLDIDRRTVPADLITGYLGMIKQLKDIETRALVQLNKINTLNRTLQQDRESMKLIVNDQKKKKKK